jgi:hypothetical protein
MRKIHWMLAIVALLAQSIAPIPAFAQDVVVVDGEMWLRSTPELRKAFLVGAANMIALEKAYAMKTGTAQPPVGVLAAKAADGMTLEQVIDRITRWYEANPARHDVPVMGVLWIDLIKPAAASQ